MSDKIVKDAINVLYQNQRYEYKRFYGEAKNLSLGTGMLLETVVPFLFGQDNNFRFRAAVAPAYVLTHECDIDQNNNRNFNEWMAVYPIIPLDQFVLRYEQQHGWDRLKQFLLDLAADQILRAFFLPPVDDSSTKPFLSSGGIIDINWLASVKISIHRLCGSESRFALSAYAVQLIDRKIANCLFRGKSEHLPFSIH